MTHMDHSRSLTLRERLVHWAYPINRAFLPYQCVDAGTLKIVAAVTMFIDHLAYAFLELPAPGRARLMDTMDGGILLDALGRMIGRTAMPIFAFLIVEGYIHTRSRARYLLRLLVFAVLSAYPFKALFYPYDAAMHCDTLFTLALGLIAVWVTDTVLMRYIGLASEREVPPADENAEDERCRAAVDPLPIRILQILIRLMIAAAATTLCCLTANYIGADYRYGGVLLVVILYLLRGIRIAGVALGYAWISWYNSNEIYAFLAMVLLQCYNGRRGQQLRYFYYLFYPGHLLLLLILRRMTLGF